MARVSRKGVLVAAGVAGLGLVTFAAQPVKANAVLFTTSADFTAWQSNAVTATPSLTFDADGSTTNGIGNDTTGPGTSPGGSLQIPADGRTSTGFATLAFDPNGEAFNPAFMAAVDPGSVAAFQPPNFVSGSTAAYSGTLFVTYTIPTFTGFDNSNSPNPFFQIGVNLAYAADGFFGTFFGSTINTQTIGGLTTVTDAIPYTISAGSMNGFGFAFEQNTNETGKSTYFIDDAEVSVPEPASMSLIGLAGLGMLKRRRK